MWCTLVPSYGVPANYSANAIERFMRSFINNHSSFDLLSMKIKEAARHLIKQRQHVSHHMEYKKYEKPYQILSRKMECIGTGKKWHQFLLL
jgi:hypothetical protein